MRSVIDGKIYDTDRATYVCDLICDAMSPSDFGWHDTSIYKSAGGTYFVSGVGGPMSMWARAVAANEWTDGFGIRLISESDAREFAEDANLDAESYEEVFGPCAIG
jgi:hypothetical protein